MARTFKQEEIAALDRELTLKIAKIYGGIQNPTVLVTGGAPRCGKDTQVKPLSQRFGIPMMPLGDMLRKAADDNPHDADFQAVKKSQLVPDYIINYRTKLWLLAQLKKPNRLNLWILNGPMRTRGQQIPLMEYMLAQKINVKVFWITTSPEECAKRPVRADRAWEDAVPEKVQQRINDYKNETDPVRVAFRDYGISPEAGNMLEVDNTHLTKDEVAARFLPFLRLPLTPELLFAEVEKEAVAA